MKKALLALPVLLAPAPAHALSIVSLHGGPLPTGSVETGILVVSILALAAAIAFRVSRH